MLPDVTIGAVAELLGVSRWTARRYLVDKHAIEGSRLMKRGRWKVTRASVHELLAQKEVIKRRK
jgi:excisionase family DNA binding protein